MTIALSADARMIQDQAIDFFAERSPVRSLRQLRDARDAEAISRPLWQEMADLGWPGFLVPEAHGGSGFGHLGLGLVLAAAGRTLAATPLLSTAMIGASALLLGGDQAQQAAHLPALAAGRSLFALAVDEGAHHEPDRIETRLRRDGPGFVLDGAKRFVPDGGVADVLIVAARREDGNIALVLVPADAPGLVRQRRWMVDSRNAAALTFDGVRLEPSALLAQGGPGLLEMLLDRARIGLAAEMLGTAEEAFARTVQYLKDRRQFGVPIGSFQALKHRAAEMFCSLELARAAVLGALEALDADSPAVPRLASLAKARAGDALHLIGNEAIQMHGGIGMTDEHEIGFFLKRARLAEATLGDSRFHRDRYAAIAGF
ncbi:acyl-CoA dehydrogenase family protein [Roseococcus sp. YIM B11640]|uniref:acyl-CoA dehydrogenase family protein n=1 Tax=Roseococcus sp. YIM B11640 TaxID=3133973 RepID=UPI003C7D860B